MLTYPPVKVQKVNVIGLKLLQRVVDGKVQALFVVAGVVDSLAFAQLMATVSSCESELLVSILDMANVVHRVGRNILGSDHHHISVLLFLHPFSNPVL